MPVVDLLDLDRGGSSTQQERHTLKPLLPSIHKRWATTPVRRTIAPISLFAKQVAKENSVLREVFDDPLGICHALRPIEQARYRHPVRPEQLAVAHYLQLFLVAQVAHDAIPGSLEVGITVQQDLYPVVKLAVPARIRDVTDLGHFRYALVKRKPQSVLVKRAILPGTKTDHNELVRAIHLRKPTDGL